MKIIRSWRLTLNFNFNYYSRELKKYVVEYSHDSPETEIKNTN